MDEVGERNLRESLSVRGSSLDKDRATIILTMITTCRLNDLDPKA